MVTDPGAADTALGGAERALPATRWSRFLGAGADPESRRAALEALAHDYWKPLYAYVRVTWAKSHDDAKDLVQDFFVWVMESGFLSRADPLRGRFRAFVKVALRHYVLDMERRRRRKKRGGDRTLLPLLDGTEEDMAAAVPEARGRSPEEILDDAWRNEVFVHALALLEETLRKEGKEKCYLVFRDYFLSPGDDLDYAAAASRHGVGTTDVSNYLMYAKRRFRQALTATVGESVGGPGDLAGEMRWLLLGDG